MEVFIVSATKMPAKCDDYFNNSSLHVFLEFISFHLLCLLQKTNERNLHDVTMIDVNNS